MPTENQKRVAKAVIDKVRKGEKVSISREMEKVGYSKHTARQPHKVTESKGWKEIMKEHFPDEFMAKKHRQLFDKEETITEKTEDGKVKVTRTGEIDVGAVAKALDMGYKLTGKYVGEDVNILTETLEQRLKRKKLENGE